MGGISKRVVAVASACCMALVMGACGDDEESADSGDSAKISKFENHQKETLEAEDATVKQVDCEDDATFKKNSKFKCKVTWSDAQYNETLSITILDDKGEKMSYTSDSKFGGGGTDVFTGL